MTYGYTSPTATTEEDWINDVIASSAPLTTCNSTEGLSMEFGLYFVNNIIKEDDIFSHGSSACTASSSPQPTAVSEPRDSIKDLSLLDSVSSKLEIMQKNHSLTPKALELIFNTKDVLKDSSDWMLGPQHHKNCAKKLSSCYKKRRLRRKSSAAQKNKVDKKNTCCESAFSLQLSTAHPSPTYDLKSIDSERVYSQLTPLIASQVTSQVNSVLQSRVNSRSNSESDLLLNLLIDPVSESPETEYNEANEREVTAFKPEFNEWNTRFDFAFEYGDAVVFPPMNMVPDNGDLMKECMADINII